MGRRERTTPKVVAETVKRKIKARDSMTATAEALGLATSTLSNQLNGDKYISPKMAMLLHERYEFNYLYMTAGYGKLLDKIQTGTSLTNLQKETITSPKEVAIIAKSVIRSKSSLKETAELIGFKQSTLTWNLRGERYIPPKLAAFLAKNFNLSYDFLTEGEGEAYETMSEQELSPSTLDTETLHEDHSLDSPSLKKLIKKNKRLELTPEEPLKMRTTAEERLVYLEARVNFLKSVILRIAAVVCEETQNKEAKEDIRLLVASLTEGKTNW